MKLPAVVVILALGVISGEAAPRNLPEFSLPPNLSATGRLPKSDESLELVEQGEFARALPALLGDYQNARKRNNLRELATALLFMGKCFAGLGDYAQAEVALLSYREVALQVWTVADRRGGMQPALHLADFYDQLGNYGKSQDLRREGLIAAYSWETKKDYRGALKMLEADVVDFAGNDQIRAFETFLEIADSEIRYGSEAEAKTAVADLTHLVSKFENDNGSSEELRLRSALVLARYELRVGKADVALAAIQKAMQAYTKATEETTYPKETYLLNARAFFEAGKTAEAQQTLEKVPVEGRKDDFDRLSLGLLLEGGDPDKLRSALADLEKRQLARTREVLAISSEQQRIRFTQSLRPYALPLALHDAAAFARNALRYKGLILDSLLQDGRARERSSDPATRTQELALAAARQKAHGLLRVTESEEIEPEARQKAAAQYQSALAQLDEIEGKLARGAAGYGLVRSALGATPEVVLRQLPANKCLIDYVLAERYAGANKFEPVYVAVRYWRGALEMRVCGPRAEIDRQIRQLHTAVEAPEGKDAELSPLLTNLHEQLLGPWTEPLPAEAGLLISPDGELNFLPFAALTDRDGKLLVERFSIALLASGREAVAEAPVQKPEKSLLIGNPDFARAPVRATAAAATIAPTREQRGSAQRRKLDPLPGTEQEVRILADLFAQNQVKAERKTGAEATEELVRKASDYDLIHIATHGMYLEVDPSPKDVFSPMSNGMVALAGAQRTLDLWAAGKPAERQTDGMIAADEFATFNLRKTKTIVLSACETGLGKNQPGEGVMGLRRGLHQAGVRNLVVTLWPIDDAATVEVMRSFYTQTLEAGEAPVEAMAAAQREMIAKWRARKAGLGEIVYVAAPFVVSLGGAGLEEKMVSAPGPAGAGGTATPAKPRPKKPGGR